jgi:hypothetical protein
MLIKSLVLILVNDSISGNKKGRALAMNAKKEKRKKEESLQGKFNVSKLSEQFV